MEETRQQVDGVGQGDPHVGALLCLDTILKLFPLSAPRGKRILAIIPFYGSICLIAIMPIRTTLTPSHTA